MKTKHTAALLLLALLASVAGPARADGSINGYLAGRDFKNETFLDPVDNPGSIGIIADIGLGPAVPVFISASGTWSNDSNGDTGTVNDTDLDMAEASVGLKLMPQSGMVRPYVGAGTLRTWVHEKRSSGTFSDSDTSKGWYVDGGGALWIGRHFDVGANIRWVTDTDLTLFGVRGDVDSRIYSVFAGFTWGEAPPRHHRRRE